MTYDNAYDELNEMYPKVHCIPGLKISDEQAEKNWENEQARQDMINAIEELNVDGELEQINSLGEIE